MKTARTDRHSHNLLIHLFGVLLLVGSAAAVVLLHFALRDLWLAADEFGKGMMVGTLSCAVGLLAGRAISKGR